MWERIVALAGGSNSRFGVLTAGSVPASQDPNAETSECSNAECNGEFYSNILRRYGAASAEWIPLDLDRPAAAEDAALAEKVRGMTGFFLGGGDQSRYTTLLLRGSGGRDSAMLAAIRASVQAGAVIAGTSAGAAVLQGSVMVTGGESYYGVRDGSFSSQPSDDPDRLTYRAAGGLGLFTPGLVDTHFAARGRQGRLIRLAVDTSKSLGFGVDEDTALVATGRTLSVLGRRSVHIFDMRDARVTGSGSWGVSTVRWSALATGDAYDVATSRISRAPGSSTFQGEDEPATFRSRDVFSSPDAPSDSDGRAAPYEMVRLAEDLISSRRSDTTEAETWETDPTFDVTLSVGRMFAAWRSPSDQISFHDIVVDIDRV